MAGLAAGGADFAALARRLKDAGEMGLKKQLYDAINEAAKPIAREITNPEHLRAYLPDRYAEALAADLTAKVSRITSTNPGVRLIAVANTKAREGRRRVRLLDSGRINHPVYPRSDDRSTWNWVNGQSGGMRAGFFSDPCDRSAPQVREKILAAMSEVAAKITSG